MKREIRVRSKHIYAAACLVSLVILFTVRFYSSPRIEYPWENMEEHGSIPLEKIAVSRPYLDVQKKLLRGRSVSFETAKTVEGCKTFIFFPSDWTLQWTPMLLKTSNHTLLFRLLHPSPQWAQLFKIIIPMENTLCRQLFTSFVHNPVQVKQMVLVNGTMVNLGCTKYTKKCKEGPHFDTKRDIRINMPPCCLDKYIQMLKIVSTELRKLRIPHMMISGGVIGWLRNGKIIPYDADLDVIVNGTYWRSPAMLKLLDSLSKEHGYVQVWSSNKESFGLETSKQNTQGLGLWSYRLMKGNSRKIHIDFYGFPDVDYGILNPPRAVTFEGVETFIMNDPVPLLDKEYGKGKWEFELSCKRIDKENAKVCLG